MQPTSNDYLPHSITRALVPLLSITTAGVSAPCQPYRPCAADRMLGWQPFTVTRPLPYPLPTCTCLFEPFLANKPVGAHLFLPASVWTTCEKQSSALWEGLLRKAACMAAATWGWGSHMRIAHHRRSMKGKFHAGGK